MGKETAENKGADGYGLARYWGEAMENNMGTFKNKYKKLKKDYEKTTTSK